MSLMNDYEESISEISVAMETNLSIMDVVIRYVENFTGSIQSLFHQLSKISYELPNRRDKKSIFERKKIFKKEHTIDFCRFEPNFISSWNNLASVFILKQPGLLDFTERLKNKFVVKLKNIRKIYDEGYNEFKNNINSSKKELKIVGKEYKQSYEQYNNCCKKIEELKKKLENEKNDEQIMKIQQGLTEELTNFPILQDNTVNSINKLNEQKYEYSLVIENSFTIFENTEKKREEMMQQLFTEFSGTIINYANTKQEATQNLQKMVTSINLEEELKLYKEDNRNKNITDISYEIAKLPFEISAFVQPRALFEPELSYSGAIVIKNYVHQKENEIDLVEGERVIIKEYLGSTLRVLKETTNEDGLAPAECFDIVPELQRALYKVIKNHIAESQEELSVNNQEFVMAIETTEKGLICVNAYKEKGLVPIDCLKETI